MLYHSGWVCCQDNLQSPRSSPTKEVMLAHKSNSQTLMKMSPGRPIAALGFCFEYTSHGVDRDCCGDICHEPIGWWSYRMSLSCAVCLWRKYQVTSHQSLDRGYLAKNERWKSDWICQRRVGIGRGGTLWHRSEWKETWQSKYSFWKLTAGAWKPPTEEGNLLKKEYIYHIPNDQSSLVVKALSA